MQSLLVAAQAFLSGDAGRAESVCEEALRGGADGGDFEHLRDCLRSGVPPRGLEALCRGGIDPAAAIRDAHHHHGEGRLLTARLLYDAILAMEPTHRSALHNLGVLRIQRGDLKGGLDLIGRAVDHHGMAADIDRTLSHVTTRYLEQVVRSTDDLSRQLAAVAPLMPKLRGSPGAYTQLFLHFGNATARLSKAGQHETAVRFAKVAMAFEPGRFDILFNLGFSTEMSGAFEDAAVLYRRAAVAGGDRSRHAHACLMLMHLFFRLGRWSEFRGLLAHKYDYDVVSWWKTYLPIPVWDGTVREGARVLIHGESGFGDVIQCLRYADYFSQRGMTAYFISVPALKPLCALGKGVAGALTQGDRLPAVDFRVQSFDLFYMLESDPDRCFGSGPYIEIARSPHRAPTLERKDGDFLIGIKWTTTDRSKDLPLELFSKLLLRDGIRLISLQPEQPDEGSGLTVERPLDPYFADPAHSFVSTAWVIDQMDLVVTADSVVAHLAGAVGARTWVALRAVPDCRWLVDRTDTPFYDSATLFRQKKDEPWAAVFDAMAEALREHLDRAGPVPARCA